MSEQEHSAPEAKLLAKGAVQTGAAFGIFVIVGGMLYGGWTWYNRSRGGVGLAWLGCMAIVIVSLLLICAGLYLLKEGLGAFIGCLLRQSGGTKILGALLALGGILLPLGLLQLFSLEDLNAKQTFAFFGIPISAVMVGVSMIATGGEESPEE